MKITSLNEFDQSKWSHDAWNLFKGMLSANSKAFTLKAKLNTLTIDIDFVQLSAEQLSLLKKIFSVFLLQQQPMWVVVRICIQDPLTSHWNKIEINQSNFFVEQEFSFEEVGRLFIKKPALFIPSIFSSLVLSLKESKYVVDLSQWVFILDTAIQHQLEIEEYRKDKALARYLKYNVDLIYQLSQDKSILEKLIPSLLFLLLRENKVNEVQELVDHPDCLMMIRVKDGISYSFLHAALKFSVNSFAILRNKLEVKMAYSKVGNSFLHLCEDPNLFTEVLRLTPDINHLNNDGDTALHVAASHNQIDKANFLLRHGADPEIKNLKGETFWTMSFLDKPELLDLYRLYRIKGHTLKYPPIILEQKGPNCGFYAVACAATLFHDNPLPARKCDQSPKAKLSLRELGKKLTGSVVGEIFSAQQLQKIIKETNCSSLVCDVRDFDHFMDIIKKVVKENLPIIIPYSSDAEKKKAENAHWSVIFGWKQKADKYVILMADRGLYRKIKAKDLFDAFYSIEPDFPGQHFEKSKGGEWLACTTNSEVSKNVPKTSLSDFIRKFVIVFPDGYDYTQLNIDSVRSVILKK